MNDPNFGEKKNDKRVYIMKKVAKSLVIPYAQCRFKSKQIHNKIKLVIETFEIIKCSNETVEEPRVKTKKNVAYVSGQLIK